MGTLVFQANLGGSVNLIGPNTASTVNFTLPSADGTNGQALVTNGSGTLSFSSFVSSAAGSNTQVQFNSGGAFAGSANLTFDGTTLTAAGLSGPLNGSVGATTPSTGAFTTLSASSTITFSGGTANGVLYLNGSKVATSGSALTFDGSNLGVTGYIQSANYLGATGGGNASYYFSTATGSTFNNSGVPYLWQIGGTEYMRLTSTGLGIGTSSPGAKISTVMSSTGTAAQFNTTNSASGSTAIAIGGYATTYDSTTGIHLRAYTNHGSNTLSSLAFEVNGTTEVMRLDSSGNLGLGVTPSAWGFGGVLQLAAGTSFASVYGADIAFSAYFNGSWKYQNSTYAPTWYSQAGGAHKWYTAPIGTAGDAITFTQAMTLDANGNLGLGITSLAGNTTNRIVHAQGADSANFVVTRTGAESGSFYAFSNAIWVGSSTSSPLIFTTNATERARIDSSGNLLVGTTSNGITDTNSITLEPKVSGGGYAVFNHQTGSSSGRQYVYFAYGGGSIGSITQSGTTAVLYNVTSDQRLKENIVDAPEFGGVIDSIKVRSYDWKADGNHQRAGFVAQELVTVAPEAVHQPADPEQMMAVDYSKLVPMLVKEIQSLRARVAQLESN